MLKYVVMFILVLVSLVTYQFSTHGDMLVQRLKKEQHWLDLSNARTTHGFVVAGDSRAYYGIDPAHFEDGMNLGFSNISFTPHYLAFLDRRLKNQGTILLGLTAQSFTGLQGDESLRSYEVGSWPLWHKLSRYWSILRPSLAWLRPQSKQHMKEDLQEVFHASGWIEARHQGTRGPHALAEHYKQLGTRMKVNEVYLAALRAQVSAWSKRGVRVVFTWLCFAEDVCQAERQNLLSIEREREISRELEAQGAKEIPVEGEYLTFDGDHLVRDEAQRLSILLKQRL